MPLSSRPDIGAIATGIRPSNRKAHHVFHEFGRDLSATEVIRGGPFEPRLAGQVAQTAARENVGSTNDAVSWRCPSLCRMHLRQQRRSS